MSLQSRRTHAPPDLSITTPFATTAPPAPASAFQLPHHPISLPPPNTHPILTPAPPSRPVRPLPYKSIISTSPTGYDAIDRAQVNAVHADQWIHDRGAQQRWEKEMVIWKGEMEKWNRGWSVGLRLAGKREGWVMAVVDAEGAVVGGVGWRNGAKEDAERGVGDGRKEAWVLLSEYEREQEPEEEKEWWDGIGKKGWRWWQKG